MKTTFKSLFIAILVIAGLSGFSQNATAKSTANTDKSQVGGSELLSMKLSGKDAHYSPASQCNVNITVLNPATCNLTPNGLVSVEISNSNLSYPFQCTIGGTTLSGATYGPVDSTLNNNMFVIDSLLPGTYYINFNANPGICPYGIGADTFIVGVEPNPIYVTSDVTGAGCSGSIQFAFLIGGATNPISYFYSDSDQGPPISSGTTSADSIQINNALSMKQYFIWGTDSTGCAFYDSTAVIGQQTYGGQTICIVTVDSTTNKNNIIWQQTPGQNIAYYKIYKQDSQTSQNDSIGVVNIDSLSVFLDEGSNPAQQSSTYFISIVDNCGNESGLSAGHTTIHLSANLGINNEVNLQWNPYIGFSYNNFEIYRSNNGSAFSLLGTVSNTSYSYSDLTPPSGVNNYYVAVENAAGCNPSRSYNSSASNILNNLTLSVGNVSSQPLTVMRANQSGLFLLDLPGDGNLLVYDDLGQLLSNKKNEKGLAQVDLGAQAKGLYIIQFRTSEKLYYAKIVNE
jgi:hypothetical protein